MTPNLDALELPYDPNRIVSDYARMSTLKQLKGGSLRRQLAAATAWVERYGGRLEDPIRDIGVSAYRGANSRRGALAGYIERVRSGQLPPCSVLFVENVDRLSREPPFLAYDLIRELLRLRIFVVLFDLGWVLSEDTLIRHPGRISDLINYMQRSHNDSATKSVRSLEASEERRRRAKGGAPYSRTGPAWLTWTETGWEKNTERSRVIERIFSLALAGMGSYRIALNLNQESVATFGGSAAWQSSYVSKILRNEAVVGTWQPMRLVDGKEVPAGDPIEGHFPNVIDKADFLKVQREILPKNAPGPKGKHFTNLFTGRCRCDLCGSSMTLISSQKKGKQKFGYLVCSKKARLKACDAPRNFRSDLIEDAVLRHVDVDLGRIVHDKANSMQVMHLIKAIGDVEYKIEQAEKAHQNFTAALGLANPDSFNSLMALINARSSEIVALRAEVSTLKDDLDRLNGTPPDLAADLQRLRDKLDKASGEERYRLRARLSQVLADAITEMVCDPVRHEVRVKTGNTHFIFSGAGDVAGVIMPHYDTAETDLRDWSEQTQVKVQRMGDSVRIDSIQGAVMYKLTWAPTWAT
ncbi:recombinase family protein [Methylobacterium sp. SyP6R]|uniref:recombinase family protein n=1 Tax=Methylobacterium sp. SyP6R TaxID=2718876 RepID=UPI001F30F9FD|nr:recombinase family protein [Methylobacterium sp. SyP6R]MCF4129017.1 recombinase family protein [Methylobacterium sp. SyP6R]